MHIGAPGSPYFPTKFNVGRHTPIYCDFTAFEVSVRKYHERDANRSARSNDLLGCPVKDINGKSLHIPFEPFDDLLFAVQTIDAERVVVSGVNVQFVRLTERLCANP